MVYNCVWSQITEFVIVFKTNHMGLNVFKVKYMGS